jgi:hypothetical protein
MSNNPSYPLFAGLLGSYDSVSFVFAVGIISYHYRTSGAQLR